MPEPRKVTATISVGTMGRDRGKSLNDIFAQRDRIIEGSQGNRSRIDRAMAISRQYVNNIRNTDENAFDRLRPQERARIAVEEARRRGYTTAEQANADRELRRRYGTYRNDFFNRYLESINPWGEFNRPYTRIQYTRNR